MQWFNELQRVSTSPENAARLFTAFGHIDVTDLLSQVRVPTLVLHCRSEAVVPFDEGRRLASLIPGARFVALEGQNHLLLEHEPAWGSFLSEVRRFLGTAREVSDATRIRSAADRGAQWLSPGVRLDHYEILSFLGSGGMGEVHLARDVRLEREVAIKVVRSDTIGDAKAHARLLREARHASGLNHPNICTIHEVGDANGHTFIVMERVKGEPLDALVRSHGLTPEDVMRYAAQIADALAHAHDNDVVHGDLKSANVLITPEGRVKVLDFGLATRLSADALSETTTRSRSSLTEKGSIVGTLAYMAPELLRGTTPDPRSDLWALGVVLYEMATGELPFRGQSAFDLGAAILESPAAALPATCPTPLRTVVRRCLAKDPGQRYQRAAEVRAVLEAAA
jgi:serine/threonine protein kinase